MGYKDINKATLRKAITNFMVKDVFISKHFAFEVELGNNNVDIVVFDYDYLGYSGIYGLEIFTPEDATEDLDRKIENLKKFCFKFSVVLNSSDTRKIKYIQENYRDVGIYLVDSSFEVRYSIPKEDKINKPDIEEIVENMKDWQLKILDPNYINKRELLSNALRENGAIMDFWAKTLGYSFLKGCNYVKNNIDSIQASDLVKVFKGIIVLK